ncbi:Protein kinase domain-containing protein, partial [Aspergillus brunneoviolaceus CBS 621.78]
MNSFPVQRWGYDFRHLIDLITRDRKHDPKYFQSYRHIRKYDSELAAVIRELLEPGTKLASNFPSLHQVLSHRYNAALAGRETEVSRCRHVEKDSGERYDSHQYQTRLLQHPELYVGRGEEARKIGLRWKSLCKILKKQHFVIRGILGSGSYGIVLLAHKRDDEGRLYAIKMENLVTIATTVNYHEKYRVVGTIGPSPVMAPLFLQEDEHHYIPVEAYILLLANECGRFPTLDSVYSHKLYQAIVMSAHLDEAVAEASYTSKNPDYEELLARKFGACTASQLIRYKKSSLEEHMICKVASQLLEGVAYLRDMHICHDDLKNDNFIIEEDLNTIIIDIGLYTFALTDNDYLKGEFTYVPAYEGGLTPELTLELFRARYIEEAQKDSQFQIKLPHDQRMTGLWVLASNIYELLHGIAPWEDPKWDRHIGYVQDWRQPGVDQTIYADRKQALNARRKRVINKELPLSEMLSQDCADAMLMMFAKDPGDRPTLPEVESCVWFGQWKY